MNAQTSEPVTLDIVNLAGKSVGKHSVAAGLTSAAPMNELVHETVRWQRATARAGTHSCLSRSNMKGGKKKPFKQKGTGRARAGSSVSPLWVGGAVVHGPHPRDYTYRLSKRSKTKALIIVLNDRIAAGRVIVVDDLTSLPIKTKGALEAFRTLGVADRKVLAVFGAAVEQDPKCTLGIRNIPNVRVLSSKGLNVYDILDADFMVVAKEAVQEIETRILAGKL